jgi:sulfopyruvate decarboxylase subunit beta
VKRLDALRAITRAAGDCPLVVTCGATAREFVSLGERARTLPLLDSMGLTSAVGLGIALGYAGPVGVVDGDGSMLMGFSILPTLASVRPPNLTVILLDNQQHASADEMPSQSAEFDLGQAIRGCGIRLTEIAGERELEVALVAELPRQELSVVLVRIEGGNTAGIPLLLADPAVLANRFASSIRSREPDSP